MLVNSIYLRKEYQASGSLAVSEAVPETVFEKWAIEQLLSTQIKGFLMSGLTPKL